MASVTFYGHETMTYMDYIDVNTGKTLVCHPGQTYTVIPASGNPRSAGTTMPGDGRFSAGSGQNALVSHEEEPAGPDAGSSGETLPARTEASPAGTD